MNVFAEYGLALLGIVAAGCGLYAYQLLPTPGVAWAAVIVAFAGGCAVARSGLDNKIIDTLTHVPGLSLAAGVIGAVSIGVAVADLADLKADRPAMFAAFVIPVGFVPFTDALRDDTGRAIVCGLLAGIFALRPMEKHAITLRWASLVLALIGGISFALTDFGHAIEDTLPWQMLGSLGLILGTIAFVDALRKKPGWISAVSTYFMSVTLTATGLAFIALIGS